MWAAPSIAKDLRVSNRVPRATWRKGKAPVVAKVVEGAPVVAKVVESQAVPAKVVDKPKQKPKRKRLRKMVPDSPEPEIPLDAKGRPDWKKLEAEAEARPRPRINQIAEQLAKRYGVLDDGPDLSKPAETYSAWPAAAPAAPPAAEAVNVLVPRRKKQGGRKRHKRSGMVSFTTRDGRRVSFKRR